MSADGGAGGGFGSTDVKSGTLPCGAKVTKHRSDGTLCDLKELDITVYNGFDDDFYGGPEEEEEEDEGKKEGSGSKESKAEKEPKAEKSAGSKAKAGEDFMKPDSGEKSHAFKFTRRLAGEDPGKAPPHLVDRLQIYDFVLEVLATASDGPQGKIRADNEKTDSDKLSRHKMGQSVSKRDTKPDSTFTASAQWKAQCGIHDHHTLRATWEADGEAKESRGQKLKEAVFAEQYITTLLQNPIEVAKRILDHQSRTREYVIFADSCGQPGPGHTVTETLQGLVVAVPVDQWGVVFKFNGPVFAWSSSESKEKQDKKAEESEEKYHEAREIKYTSLPKTKDKKRLARYRRSVENKDKKILALWKDARGLDRSAKSHLADLAHGYELETKGHQWIEYGVILNGREVTNQDAARLNASYQGLKSCVEKLKNAADAFHQLMTFWNNVPKGVQPQFALEFVFADFEVEFSTRYRIHSSGERFLAMTRRLLIEGEGTLVEAQGTIALVAGYMKWGTGATLTGSVTLTGKIYAEIKIHVDMLSHKPGHFSESLWEEFKKNFEPKGEFKVEGRLEGEASVAHKDLGVAGASVEDGVTFKWEWKKLQPKKGETKKIWCNVEVHPLVAQIYANSDFSSKGGVKQWVILEASETPWVIWTFDD